MRIDPARVDIGGTQSWERGRISRDAFLKLRMPLLPMVAFRAEVLSQYQLPVTDFST
jgi:hypothetical protein